MNYIELSFTPLDEEQSEIITAFLADYPFESFSTEGKRLKAYIREESLCDCKDEVDALLEQYGVSDKRYISIENQNWNALWESNFTPVHVGRDLLIRAPFHDHDPAFATEVVIMPKMSFGTGHHSTTYLVSQSLFGLDVEGRKVLDVGCGTGVLSIVAAKLGAAHVDAIDIDEWAAENCRENIAQNGVAERITTILGDASSIPQRDYDLILANINRNILLGDMPRYAESLKVGGRIVVSGFFTTDTDSIEQCALKLGMRVAKTMEREGWAAMILHKE